MIRTLLLCSLAFLTTPLLMSQVREVDLKEMIASSGIIFSGVVTEVEGTLDENEEVVTYTTFRVEVPIRGVTPGSLKIKQLGGVTDKGTTILAHMRYFTEGERVLVMLYPPSELGFTSPIGMGQGAWSVSDDNNVLGVSGSSLSSLSSLAKQHEVIPDSQDRVPLTNMIELIQAITEGGNQ